MAKIKRGTETMKIQIKQVVIFSLSMLVILLSHSGVHAQTSGSIKVEGHAFSAKSLRPLPGVAVELWGFYPTSPSFTTTYPTLTDEGGFYRIETEFLSVDESGNDSATGYAFAFICRYNGTKKVQIMPLYRNLNPDIVYHRNVYMQVPETVTYCEGYGD
jgi:hypothetical protein